MVYKSLSLSNSIDWWKKNIHSLIVVINTMDYDDILQTRKNKHNEIKLWKDNQRCDSLLSQIVRINSQQK